MHESKDTNPMPTIARRPPTMSPYCGGNSAEPHPWLDSKDSRYGSDYLFWFSIGSDAMDQRSGVG